MNLRQEKASKVTISIANFFSIQNSNLSWKLSKNKNIRWVERMLTEDLEKVINKEFLQSFHLKTHLNIYSHFFFSFTISFFYQSKKENSIHYESFIIIFCKQQHQTIYSKIFHKWIFPRLLCRFSPLVTCSSLRKITAVFLSFFLLGKKSTHSYQYGLENW